MKMDPFTQRMLERARARQEKIDQKLASSGQSVPKRKPLTENITHLKSETPIKSPIKPTRDSLTPKKTFVTSESPVRSPNRRSVQKQEHRASPQRNNDFIVTKKEYRTPKRTSSGRRDSDLSMEINIMHRDDIKIEVHVEERDAPLNVEYYDKSDNNIKIKEIEDKVTMKSIERENSDMSDRGEQSGLRTNIKSRLDRLGILYSDKADLSSPIHRTEQEFSSATPPATEFEKMTPKPKPAAASKDGKRKFGRLAALADQINNWEDDLSRHTAHPELMSSNTSSATASKSESSTMDVSIHSLNDINKALRSTGTAKESSKPVNSRTYTKPAPTNQVQLLNKKVVAELEGEGYRRVSAGQSRLVYDFSTTKNEPDRQEPSAPTPSAAATLNMATMVAANPPTPKLNGNADRSSVLSKAAMFEAGSPRAKDPAEMSLRERKALFEKNKGVAIIPKAPFGQAPSAKALLGNNKADSKPIKSVVYSSPTKPNSRTASKENIPDDNISQNSIGGGIKGKLAALFNKEQTISETTIANKFKQEREKEMEMLQNRFQYKPKPEQSDHKDEDSDHDDQSENVPLMASSLSLSQTAKKPEIISNIPKVTFEKTQSVSALNDDEVQTDSNVQTGKRRSSHETPVVLSALDDVKRIKVNNVKKDEKPNGVISQQPGLYPHLSDIETDTSHTQDEYSECGGSSEDNVNLNKSDNWAETSFGREVMNVVKKNNTSYKKAVRDDSDTSVSDMNSELDDLLDEALNDDESEGPTPPKLNKHGNVLPSKSFTYEDGSPVKKQFKSPLKLQPATPRGDRANELVHSVSFYRRMQNASQPTTPVRVVRHDSPEPDIPATPEVPPATTVRQRIKELQSEINKQQTVISQASQALNLCASTVEFSGSSEQAEGERLLLLASHRRQACVHEVQRLQVEGAGAAAARGMAALHVRGLRVPLRRDYMRQLNADGAVGHHAVCLLKCRDRVLASSMQQTSPAAATLHFPDEIRMDGLASDFKVTIEVYLLQASKEILPHDVKYHINKKNKSNSKLLTPKSKVSELKAPRVQSPGGPHTVRSTQFQLHGYCIFALQQAARETFTLNKVPCGSPLEGSINLNIKARVRVSAPDAHAAFLTAFDDVSGLGAWHRRWFLLQPPRLSYWKYPDDVHKKMPIGDIDLSTVTSERVTRAPRDLCARPNTLLLESAVPAGLIVPDSGSLVYFRRADGAVVRRHLLAADTQKDRDIWLDTLNKALEYVRCCKRDDD